MINGHFFTRENYKGLTTYRYTAVKAKQQATEFEYPEHPLSVTLSEKRISFRFYGKVKQGEPTQIFDLFDLDLHQLEDSQSHSNWVIEDLCYESISLYNHYDYQRPDAPYFKNTIAMNLDSTKAHGRSIVKTKQSNQASHFKQYHFFLDFLFDFFHSRTFQHSDNYQRIKRIFLSNTIISGILAKCDYFYWVAQHNALVAQNKEKPAFQESGLYKDCLIRLAEADSVWVEKILTTHNLSLFSINSPWFFNSERELKQATHQKIMTPSGSDWKKYVKEIIQSADGKKDIFSRFRILHQNLNTDITTFWVRRYNIFESSSFNFGISRLRIILIIIILFLLLMGGYTQYVETGLSPDYFFYWAIAFILFCGTLGAIPTIFPIFLFLRQIIPNKNFNRSLISTFLPRMQLGIISGWLIFATSDDLWKINYDIMTISVGIFSLLLLLLSFYYINNEVQREAPDLQSGPILLRSLVILFTGFTISVFIGVWVMNFEGQKMIQRIPEIQQKYKMKELMGLRKSEHEMAGLFEKYNRLDRLVISYHNVHQSDEIDEQYYILISELMLDTLSFPQNNPKCMIGIDTFRYRVRNLEARRLDNKEKRMSSMAKQKAEKKRNQIKDKLIADFHIKLTSAITTADKSLSQTRDELLELQSEMADEGKSFRNFLDNASTELWDKPNGEKPYFAFEVKIPKNSKTINTFVIIIYPILLFFNAVLALFVGLFVQLLLQQKNITDPI